MSPFCFSRGGFCRRSRQLRRNRRFDAVKKSNEESNKMGHS